jgi:DNA-directed RNA polymerase sigma subunit (sigma70/sigma32)
MEWLDRLVDQRPSQELVLAEADELAQRRKLLGKAMVRLNEREREIVIERRLRDEPLTLEDLSQCFHGIARADQATRSAGRRQAEELRALAEDKG